MVERALLMIADISGYTQYMRLHRMSLAHSQEITGRLLEAMVHATPQLDLIEIEGDAAFLYALVDDDDEPVAHASEVALTMHQAFHAQQDRMIGLNMCSCPGCIEAGRLRVKVVAHVGEIAKQKVKRRTQLVGVDVIAVHRMLKNSVPIEEYVLMTEPIYWQSAATVQGSAIQLEDELEGLGRTTLYYVDLHSIGLEPLPPPKPTLIKRLRVTAGVVCRAMPKMLGKQVPHESAENLNA